MDVTKGANIMSAGILDGFQTIIPTAAAVLSEKRQILRLTQQEVADRANITLRQYQRLESGERSILTCSFGLACRVIEALDQSIFILFTHYLPCFHGITLFIQIIVKPVI